MVKITEKVKEKIERMHNSMGKSELNMNIFIFCINRCGWVYNPKGCGVKEQWGCLFEEEKGE